MLLLDFPRGHAYALKGSSVAEEPRLSVLCSLIGFCPRFA